MKVHKGKKIHGIKQMTMNVNVCKRGTLGQNTVKHFQSKHATCRYYHVLCLWLTMFLIIKCIKEFYKKQHVIFGIL
jgi:hypothetical protein